MINKLINRKMASFNPVMSQYWEARVEHLLMCKPEYLLEMFKMERPQLYKDLNENALRAIKNQRTLEKECRLRMDETREIVYFNS